MVREVGIHDDDEVALSKLQAVWIGGAEAELAFAGLEDDVRGVGFHELLCDILGTVRGAIIDNDKFPVEVAGGEEWWLASCVVSERRKISNSVN